MFNTVVLLWLRVQKKGHLDDWCPLYLLSLPDDVPPSFEAFQFPLVRGERD